MNPREHYARKQVAARRLFLDGRGQLNPDARVLAADLKKFCKVDGPQIAYDGEGKVDPVATACMAARREVWNRLQAWLHLDVNTVVNLRENENA